MLQIEVLENNIYGIELPQLLKDKSLGLINLSKMSQISQILIMLSLDEELLEKLNFGELMDIN
jgi:hypothetical protein